MKTKVTFLVSIILLCLGCEVDPQLKLSDVKRDINNIGKDCGGKEVEFPFTLYSMEMFKRMSDNVEIYQPFLIQIIIDNKTSHLDKSVALYALQHQCVDKYILVLEQVFEAYQKGKIDDSLLELAINQGGLSIEIIKNYENPALIKLLKKIAKTGKCKDEIEDILSGQRWKNALEYYGNWNSGEPMPWHCDLLDTLF